MRWSGAGSRSVYLDAENMLEGWILVWKMKVFAVDVFVWLVCRGVGMLRTGSAGFYLGTKSCGIGYS